MDSFTQFCSRRLSALALALLLTACAEDEVNFGFEIRNVSLLAAPRQLQVNISQDLEFSWEARNSLRHGVPLTISVAMEVRDYKTLGLLADDLRKYEIRYLPLSQHYQLSNADGGELRTYPRLRHAINALAALRLDFATGPLAPGDYEFRARIRLEQSSLPAPMQLPALVTGKWRHDSEWSAWPFKISA